MIPLYKPHMPNLPHISEILNSGRLAYGKYGLEFEKELTKYFKTENLIVTNTYNMAILVALSSLDIKAGDSIIVSPMACLASTQPLISMGINIIWTDIDPTSGTIDPAILKKNIFSNKNIKAIIHNHFCGHVGFIDEINNIGNEFGIPVIDDGIEAFGSEYKGKKIGNTNTDVTIFSFNPVRIPNTLDGGVVIFKNRETYEKSLLVRDAGIDRAKFRDDLGEINPQYDITIIGHSATPMELNSYIGIQQMKHVSKLIQKQRGNAIKWDKILSTEKEIRPIKNSESNPNYWVYGILAKQKRETIIKFRANNFYASGVHINNNRYSVFNNNIGLLGVSEFQNQFIALPCGWWVNFNSSLNLQL